MEGEKRGKEKRREPSQKYKMKETRRCARWDGKDRESGLKNDAGEKSSGFAGEEVDKMDPGPVS